MERTEETHGKRERTAAPETPTFLLELHFFIYLFYDCFKSTSEGTTVGELSATDGLDQAKKISFLRILNLNFQFNFFFPEIKTK